jgi:hypothetical protein
MPRIALVLLVATTLCAQGLATDETDASDRDVQAYIDALVREAGGAYKIAADAATQALKEAEASKPSKEELVEKCICDQRANTGDPCVDSGMDDSQEKKMRAEFASTCEQELQNMPGSMKEQMKNDCIKRRTESAGMEYKDPEIEAEKEAARDYIATSCEKRIASTLKPKTLHIVDDAEAVLLKCMCDRTTCRTDEEQLLLEEAEEEATKVCKKQVAMQVAEAMGEGGEGMTKEEMSAAIEDCTCEARAEGENPCLSDEEWAAKKAELEEIRDACRKPLHDDL